MEQVQQLDPWFVTGLIESAGSFTYNRQSNRSMNVVFALKVSAADRPLVDKVRAFFGYAGRIFDVKARAPRVDEGARLAGSAYYRVTRPDELSLIAAHFERYPLVGQKARSFEIWREMVALKQRFRKAPAADLGTLATLLSKVGAKGSPQA